jgi:hypothetical protein
LKKRGGLKGILVKGEQSILFRMNCHEFALACCWICICYVVDVVGVVKSSFQILKNVFVFGSIKTFHRLDEDKKRVENSLI